jgi:hypothetical protein
LLLLAGAQKLLRLNYRRQIEKIVITKLIFGASAICLIYLVFSTLSFLVNASQAGVSGYNTSIWRNSLAIKWLNENQPAGPIYSNAADAIYILTGETASSLPLKSLGNADLALIKAELLHTDAMVVYFNDDMVERPYLISEDELEKLGSFSLIEANKDGRIYKIRHK